jgi:hypothetical protein
MSLIVKLIFKIMDFRLSDLVNGFTGTFLAAPHLMAATGLNPGQEALRNLLQGLVGIILMFCTKSVHSYFQNKKPNPQPPSIPLEPARPLKLKKPHNNEESNQETQHPQNSHQKENHCEETQDC